MSRSFLLLHGVGGSGSEHWQAWLHQELVKRGETVRFPDFPDKDHPDKAVWIDRLSVILGEIPNDEDVVVVAHSLACIMWFHYAASTPKRKIQRAILVAPPSPFLEFEPVMTFFPVPDNMHKLGTAAEKTLLVLSSTDPYCPVEDAAQYLDLGVPCVMLPGMGHINVEAGYGPWPWILELILNHKVTL